MEEITLEETDAVGIDASVSVEDGAADGSVVLFHPRDMDTDETVPEKLALVVDDGDSLAIGIVDTTEIRSALRTLERPRQATPADVGSSDRWSAGRSD
jgi:hypothetical protein